MASALIWKVYNGAEHVGSLRYAEDAAVVVGNTSEGTVKADGRIVWHEGREEVPACDFVDMAADIMIKRRRNNFARRSVQANLTRVVS